MFGPHTYHKIAVNLITNILLKGKAIIGDAGVVIGQKNSSNIIIGYGAYKGDDNKVMDPLYEGIDPAKAADAYVKLVGPIVAIGDAVKHHRKENATITADTK